jgi:DNA-binding transcriptional MerR regulator
LLILKIITSAQRAGFSLEEIQASCLLSFHAFGDIVSELLPAQMEVTADVQDVSILVKYKSAYAYLSPAQLAQTGQSIH